jgi:pimeloyl-ACP methyl ester carboxylesterase
MSNQPSQKNATLKPAMIAAGSVLAGLLATAALVALAGPAAQEHTIIAAIMFGFAGGWTLLTGLSTRFTDRPQRWAAVPAVAMTLTALALVVLAPGAAALSTLGWIWPPLLLALVVWMTRHARRDEPSRAARWLLYPVFAVLALAAAGGAYETLSSSGDTAVADTTGHRLVDVGGHRLDIRCIGSGRPTVVLETGLGESASAMARWIAPSVARTTRVCTYDRPGHGRSEPAAAKHIDAARDLHVLLQRSGVAGPYVIAGHSLGGALALSYTHRYPAEVAGLVLLDSMHPRQTNAFAGMDPLLALVPTLARTGLGRLLADPEDGDPVAQARQLVLDIAAMPAELNSAARTTSLGDRPLAVITAGRGSQPGWVAHQDQLAALSSNSEHRIVAGSTHTSLIDDQADAAESSHAVRDVVRAIRGSGRR